MPAAVTSYYITSIRIVYFIASQTDNNNKRFESVKKT